MIRKAESRLFRGRAITPTYGIVDIGSRNCHLSIYGIGLDDKWHKMKSLGATIDCGLGDGIWNEPEKLRKENLNLAIKSIGAFRAILTEQKISTKNTLVGMTEAIRAIQNTKQGQKDTARLFSACKDLPTYIMTGKEEAFADGLAIRDFCPQSLIPNGQRFASAFAAIGGGSLQLGIITPWGKITNILSLPYGIYRMHKESGANPEKATALFRNILNENSINFSQDNLIVLGRQWRALGDAVCDELPYILKGDDIRHSLAGVMGNKIEFHRAKKRVKECEPYLPVSAALLDCITERFGTIQLEFVDTTIRDALARTLHEIRTGIAIMPPAGLERLFSHLTP